MPTSENHRTTTTTTEKKPKNTFSNGPRNWIIVVLILILCNFVIENLSRYGLKCGPLELVTLVTETLIQNRKLYIYTLAYYLQQILQTFALEKLLAAGRISDKLGLTLHAINTWYLPIATIITSRFLDGNPYVTRFIMTYTLFVTTKIWSYAYVNFTYRKAARQKEPQGGANVGYPKNVTLRNIVTYMVLTPPIEYRANYPERTKPELLILFKLIGELFMIYCAFAFILIQFVLPELTLMKLKGSTYADMLRCLFRIAVPMHMIWLVYNPIQIFGVLLPSYARVTGMKDAQFTRDWWNSESMTVFWRKWNLPVHNCLKHNVAIPLMRKGYSQFFTNVICFAIAGFLHEYLNSWPFGLYDGIAMAITMGEMVGGTTSTYIQKEFGNDFGNMLFWIYTIMTIAGGTIHIGNKLL